MSDYKRIRNFLGSLDQSEFDFLNIQLSLASDAKRMISEFSLTREQFGVMMELKDDRQIDKYLSGSFDYSIKHLAKMRANWYKLETDLIENGKERHEVVEIAKEINQEKNPLEKLLAGDFVEFKFEHLDEADGEFTLGRHYQVVQKYATNKINKKHYFKVYDNNLDLIVISCDTLRFKRIQKVLFGKEPNLERNLNTVNIGESILTIRKISDHEASITNNKCYPVIGFEDILSMKHLILLDDEFRKIAIPIESKNWFAVGKKEPNFIETKFDFVFQLNEARKGDTVKCVNLDDSVKGIFTIGNKYEVVGFRQANGASVKKSYIVIVDELDAEVIIYVNNECFVFHSAKKTIPEDLGNFKGKYLFTATHIEKGDELICINETNERNELAEFTYSNTYVVSEEAKYHSGEGQSKFDYITVTDDNKNEIKVLLTSKQFVLK